MLTGLHILLSYTCLYQCEHCFLHCSPMSGGTFSFSLLERLLEQAADVGTIRQVAIEGGEPFLFYPLMAHGIAHARKLGFEVEVVSNGYWAQSRDDAALWLEPLIARGLNVLNVSDDAFHHGDMEPSPAKAALQAARDLGLPCNAFVIDPPEVRECRGGSAGRKGEAIVGGGVRFRGRAVDRLVAGLPLRGWTRFNECPDEDFSAPSRAHVDADGFVQLCQGISIGNVWERPLRKILAEYEPERHPVCGPLLRGGPAALVREFGVDRERGFAPGYVDACHLCYRTRSALRTRLPGCLAPDQAYGGSEDAPTDAVLSAGGAE